jgi:hypothetical protein
MESSASRRYPVRAWLSSVRRPATAKLLIGAAGLALLAIGAGKFAATAGDNGAIAVVIAGAVLLITPLILDRVQRVSVSATRMDLWLVSQVSDKGAPRTAEILQRTMLGSFAESYALVHDELRGPQYRSARIHLQDLLVENAGRIARQEKFQPVEVQALFANGSLVIRAAAGETALAQAVPSRQEGDMRGHQAGRLPAGDRPVPTGTRGPHRRRKPAWAAACRPAAADRRPGRNPG